METLEVYIIRSVQKSGNARIYFYMNKSILLHIFYCLRGGAGQRTIPSPQFIALVKYPKHQKSLFKTDFWAP